MSTLKLCLLFFVVVNICSCSQFRPFEDRYREPGTEYIYRGSSKPGYPSICYNPMFYNDLEIKDMADKLCKTYDGKTSAELVKKEIFSCRLFVPSKSYYTCVVNK